MMLMLFVAVAFACIHWPRLCYGNHVQCVFNRTETRRQVLYLVFLIK